VKFWDGVTGAWVIRKKPFWICSRIWAPSVSYLEHVSLFFALSTVFVYAALSSATRSQSVHMLYASFTIYHKELKLSRRILQKDKVGVEAPGTFLLALNWLRQSSVAINLLKADSMSMSVCPYERWVLGNYWDLACRFLRFLRRASFFQHCATPTLTPTNRRKLWLLLMLEYNNFNWNVLFLQYLSIDPLPL